MALWQPVMWHLVDVWLGQRVRQKGRSHFARWEHDVTRHRDEIDLVAAGRNDDGTDPDRVVPDPGAGSDEVVSM